MLSSQDGPLFVLLSLVTIAWCGLAKPNRIGCAPGWYAEGVRPSGETVFRRSPRVVPDDDDPAGAIGARIYCTGGTRPIVVDYRTVGCEARH
jgi:hypothetical protein